MWYDRQGKPLVSETTIGNPRWKQEMQKVEELLRDKDYRAVKQDYTPKKKYWVSTVWLGIDHGWGGGEPVIFETMVFSPRRNRYHVQENGKRYYYQESYTQQRYITEKQAIAGHKKLLKEYTIKEY